MSASIGSRDESRRRGWRAVTLAAALALTVGCGDGGASAPPKGAAGSGAAAGTGGATGTGATAAAARPVDPATTGSLAGRVVLDGPTPPREFIQMLGEAYCIHEHEGGGYLDERLITGPGGGIANAFVWIEDGLQGWTFPPPETAVELDQEGCLYSPRVLGIRVGQTLRIVSSDPIMHNVHIKPDRNREKNWGMPQGSGPRETEFRKPEVMIEVRCDVHAWMQGWIGAVDHPCFAVTGADGSFRIDGVPPGRYTLGVWHERLGRLSREVVVGERQDVTVEPIAMKP